MPYRHYHGKKDSKKVNLALIYIQARGIIKQMPGKFYTISK